MPIKANQKLVLVEDDHELARMIQAFLQTEGFEVSWVDNGLSGVDLILKEQPDIVVLDIMLPGIDGVEVCNCIRKSFTNPILMLTAKDDDLSEVASLNTGADGYLNKPVRPHVLLAHIKSLLRRNQINSSRLDKNIIQVQNLKINMKTYTIQKVKVWQQPKI